MTGALWADFLDSDSFFCRQICIAGHREITPYCICVPLFETRTLKSNENIEPCHILAHVTGFSEDCTHTQNRTKLFSLIIL